MLSIALVLTGAAFVSVSPLNPPVSTPGSITPQHPTKSALHSFELLDTMHKKALVGNLCALGASLLHAMYTVALSEKLRDQPPADPLALFACMGAANLAFFAPGLAVLNSLRWESFELIPKGMPGGAGHIWTVLLV